MDSFLDTLTEKHRRAEARQADLLDELARVKELCHSLHVLIKAEQAETADAGEKEQGGLFPPNEPHTPLTKIIYGLLSDRRQHHLDEIVRAGDETRLRFW